MRVIGVLDLRNGRAVHARAGDRERYAPVQSVAGEAIEPGDAPALASIYRDRFGLGELYVADLDAIEGRAPQDRLVSSLVPFGALWLDAGVSSANRACDALTLGAAHVIVGLETLGSWDALDEICGVLGGARIAFSLDLRDGPIVRVAHFDFGEGQTGKLLMIVHHLAMDGVSWRILLEDLQLRMRHQTSVILDSTRCCLIVASCGKEDRQFQFVQTVSALVGAKRAC